MKKFLLLLAGLAISASAFAQDAAATSNTELGFFGNSSEVAVQKSNIKIDNTQSSNKWFQLYLEKDAAIKLTDLKSIHIKWSSNTDTKNTALYVACKNEGESSNTNQIWYLKAESGEVTYSSSDFSIDKTDMISASLRISSEQSIVIEEFTVTKTDDTVIQGHLLLNQLDSWSSIKCIKAPCKFTFYKQYQGPQIVNPDGTAFSTSEDQTVTLAIEGKAEGTNGRFFLKDYTGGTTIKSFTNGSTSFSYTFKNQAYKDVYFFANAANGDYNFPYTAEITSVTAEVVNVSTGIDAIAAPAAVEDGMIYDLQGRALGTDINAIGHGLYIRNGKKFVK